jgi:glycosyltransferase involved in cell wall biosynthesis
VNCAAVIPCFNEAKTIGPLVAAMRQQVSLVVVVDDGSTDGTARMAENAGAVVIRHEGNQGKGASLQTGLSHVLQLGFDWAVTLDGDGQHSPLDLPPFLHRAEETGAPLIIGNRMDQAAAMPWLRRRVNRWMSARLSRCAGRALPDTQSGFRLIHLPTWASLPLSARRFEVESEMLMAFLASSHRVEFVPIHVIPAARKSRIRPFTDTVRWWKWWRSMKRNLNGLTKGFSVTGKFNHKGDASRAKGNSGGYGTFWTAATCRRFQSADMSAHSKAFGGRIAPPFQTAEQEDTRVIQPYREGATSRV